MLSFVYDIHTDVVYWSDEWTKAIIVPVHKKGESGDVANYRPLSLTCVACKLLERVMAKNIYVHLSNNNLLQPGLLPRPSYSLGRELGSEQLACVGRRLLTTFA